MTIKIRDNQDIAGTLNVSGMGLFQRAYQANTAVGILLDSTTPVIRFRESGAAGNERLWDHYVQGGDYYFRIRNDEDDDGSDIWKAVRGTGATVASFDLFAPLTGTTASFTGNVTLGNDGAAAHPIYGRFDFATGPTAFIANSGTPAIYSTSSGTFAVNGDLVIQPRTSTAARAIRFAGALTNGGAVSDLMTILGGASAGISMSIPLTGTSASFSSTLSVSGTATMAGITASGLVQTSYRDFNINNARTDFTNAGYTTVERFGAKSTIAEVGAGQLTYAHNLDAGATDKSIANGRVAVMNALIGNATAGTGGFDWYVTDYQLAGNNVTFTKLFSVRDNGVFAFTSLTGTSATWSGVNTFNASGAVGSSAIQLISNNPTIRLNEADQANADDRNWDITLNNKVLSFRVYNNAADTALTWMSVTRGTGAAVTGIALGAPLTGTSASFSGAVFSSNNLDFVNITDYNSTGAWYHALTITAPSTSGDYSSYNETFEVSLAPGTDAIQAAQYVVNVRYKNQSGTTSLYAVVMSGNRSADRLRFTTTNSGGTHTFKLAVLKDSYAGIRVRRRYVVTTGNVSYPYNATQDITGWGYLETGYIDPSRGIAQAVSSDLTIASYTRILGNMGGQTYPTYDGNIISWNSSGGGRDFDFVTSVSGAYNSRFRWLRNASGTLTDLMRLESNANLTLYGALTGTSATFTNNSNISSWVLRNAFSDFPGGTAWAVLGHNSLTQATTHMALYQENTGTTALNCAPGRTISLNVGGQGKITVDAALTSVSTAFQALSVNTNLQYYKYSGTDYRWMGASTGPGNAPYFTGDTNSVCLSRIGAIEFYDLSSPSTRTDCFMVFESGLIKANYPYSGVFVGTTSLIGDLRQRRHEGSDYGAIYGSGVVAPSSINHSFRTEFQGGITELNAGTTLNLSLTGTPRVSLSYDTTTVSNNLVTTGKVQKTHTYLTNTGATLAAGSDYVVITGSVTCTLPASTENGEMATIHNMGTGTVTISAVGAKVGVASIAQNEHAHCVYRTSNSTWYVTK